METTVLDSPAIVPFTIEPISYEFTKAEIQKVASGAMLLRVTHHNDKAGLEKCHETRMQLRDMRVMIEKKRKALKADSLEYGRKVDATANELMDPIKEAETHLLEQESIVKREQERIAREAEEQRQAKIRSRLALLQACGKAYLADDVATLSADDFAALLESERADKKRRDEEAEREEAERNRIAEQNRAEAERLAKEREALERQRLLAEERMKRMQARISILASLSAEHSFSNDELADMLPEDWESLLENARRIKAERDRAAAEERAKLELQRQEQVAEQAKIEAEKQRLAAIEAERQRQIELEKARAEAAEKARLEAIAEQERQAAEAKAQAEAAERERQRIEELRPDSEKLLAVAAALRAIELPAVSKAALPAATQIEHELFAMADRIVRLVNRMLGAQEE